VEPSYEIIKWPCDALQMIEAAARNCYKSEHRTKNGSAESLVRRLIKHGHTAMIEFGGDVYVKFTSNRGFTHELVRHRLASYAQESTRYCNYSKDKFTRNVKNVSGDSMHHCFKNGYSLNLYVHGLNECFRFCEEWYLKMVDAGVPLDCAREVLNIGLKADVVMKANIVEWRHVFRQRTSKKAHPRMRQLMVPLLLDLNEKIPVVFEDLAEKVAKKV